MVQMGGKSLCLLDKSAIKSFLDLNFELFHRPEFIETDPVQVPHLFARPEDIEIAGFLTATLSWGQRKTIIRKSKEWISLMDNRPFEFISEAGGKDYSRFEHFCHRTFNATDSLFFLYSLKNIYSRHGGLRKVFEQGFNRNQDAGSAIAHFRKIFFETEYPRRTLKHVPDTTRGSSAKRINLFLRWMVRPDDQGIDFGLWCNISPAWLCVPLDLHTGATARKLGLLTRKTNDWQAVLELTRRLREFDPDDPVRYDFALFGLSAYGNTTLSGWGVP
jgi:uncharacterized protein (TIGR02757 family)